MLVPTDTIQSQPNERNSMPNFTVSMTEVSEWSMVVEAENEAKAKEIAETTHIDEWISVYSDFTITTIIPN